MINIFGAFTDALCHSCRALEKVMEKMKAKEIKTHPLFESLFPIHDEVLNKVEEDMRQGTYDLSQPVILATWEGQKEPVCIDGHTRLKAAINAGIEELPVWTHELDTEDEALDKAIKLQRNRRNLSDADIASCMEALDIKRPRGGDRRSEEAKSKASNDAIGNSRSKSATETADLFGISTTKVERTRSVLSNGDPETVEAVKNGKKTINQACTEIRKKRNANKSAKNSETQRTKAPVVKPDQADSLSESPNESVAVPIPVGFHTVLEELGSVEYHVKRAIALYITISEEQRRKLLGETSEKNEQLKDDEDEYVDEEYEDEYDDEEAS